VIAYLDASALVKRYLVEQRSRETIALMAESEMVATSIVTENVARAAQRSFDGDWQDLLRVPVTEALVDRAKALAWDHALRGYDAVRLASAVTWQESVGTEIIVATFDTQLWTATRQVGMKAWPEDLTAPGRDARLGAPDPGAPCSSLRRSSRP